MYSDVQPFIKEDVQQTFIKQYKMLRHKLLTLLDTPVKTTHHIGGTSHFNYPTEPILDVLVGVDDLHDITALDEKRLNYQGFYRLHHPYHKKVVMAQFNNLIDLKQIARLHIVQIDSQLYNDYLKTNYYLTINASSATHFGKQKYNLATDTAPIREYENQKQLLFKQLLREINKDLSNTHH
ncbi:MULTISPECIES: GrpB family protein [Staphylococcus]|uniref:GrpB family protein n=1 Tax=Staphylococcus ureilyticus TaxID=94138 RepID=A0AB34AEY9_STAUR|nr:MULTISPECIES: GrpB family protein [Staphylococcus]KKD22498.1 hypothetical protein XA21_09795 [Staphylococcus cohnii subsp. cohnii]PIS60971.1 hypothetical protein AZH47_11365 [Corynebacterium striatum]AVL76545.1 hypothetical protein CEQ12_01655 [Staphylococcus cohnii]KKD25676.1 hypothetical protein XA22_05275 [Staphylococcus cohnii subsp. cohnii]MBL0376872.1 GrpB family protein [Staphylococcus sp. S75]